ncbi:MAG: bacillithiol biosynthesis cysteine-adding enzyme BshC [Acidobacteria bacterium]|nr:bacillithiol biosynthesis cysteine-adding enzyme BshC [Acidobacteriota bacterium]
MNHSSLDYSLIPGHPKLFLELIGSNSAERFYGAYHRGCSALQDLAGHRKNLEFPRSEISDALQSFNRRIGNSAVALDNAAKLAEKPTLALVTGQQAGLFGGPALTFYKAITAVLLARKLGEAGFNVVPVFWVASEDHDFEEIRRTSFADRDGNLHHFRLDGLESNPLTAAQREFGKHPRLFHLLEETLKDAEHGQQVLHWVRASYDGTSSLAEAFARLLSRVLGHTGLVLVDASDAAVRRLSANHYIRAVEQADSICEMLLARAQELSAAGFEPQVHWERDYTLLFYVNSSGRRAIRRSNGAFAAADVRWTPKELIREISEHCERFSPSALLRPIIQDSILPSVIYVGGPGEIAYFAQVQALTPVFGWAPVVQPRLSVTLLDPRACRYLKRNALEVTDLFCSLEALQEKMAARKMDPSLLAAWSERSRMAGELFDSLFETANRLDPSMASAWQMSRRKIEYQLDKTRRKMLRAAAEKDQMVKSQAGYLHNLVYPGRVLQERKINLLSFYARYGPALLDRLFALSPCEKFSHVLALR